MIRIKVDQGSDGRKILNAFLDEKPAGNAVVLQGVRIATLESIYVKPALEGMGIGSTLLSSAKDQARSSGAKSLVGFFTPLDKPDRVRGFYQKHGFTIDDEDGFILCDL